MRKPDLESLLAAVERVREEEDGPCSGELVREVVVAEADLFEDEPRALEAVRELVENSLDEEGD